MRAEKEHRGRDENIYSIYMTLWMNEMKWMTELRLKSRRSGSFCGARKKNPFIAFWWDWNCMVTFIVFCEGITIVWNYFDVLKLIIESYDTQTYKYTLMKIDKNWSKPAEIEGRSSALRKIILMGNAVQYI